MSIPYEGPEHYSFTVRPGNSVWGKSFSKGNDFENQLLFNERLENKEEAVIGQDKDENQETQIPRTEVLSSKTSHIMIGIGILVIIILLAYKFK